MQKIPVRLWSVGCRWGGFGHHSSAGSQLYWYCRPGVWSDGRFAKRLCLMTSKPELFDKHGLYPRFRSMKWKDTIVEAFILVVWLSSCFYGIGGRHWFPVLLSPDLFGGAFLWCIWPIYHKYSDLCWRWCFGDRSGCPTMRLWWWRIYLARRSNRRECSRSKVGFKGSNEIFFAVIASTIALVAVFFSPIVFCRGRPGGCSRNSVSWLPGAVIISSFVALTFTPMISN